MRTLVVLLALTACGRVGFEPVGDGGTGDGGGGDGSVVSRDRCPAAPRPTGAPATIVGTGTPASCDLPALTAALANGGWIGFDCGPAMHTISTLGIVAPLITKPTILDGGGRITLSGGGGDRVLAVDAAGQQVTLLDLVIADGAISRGGGGVFVAHGTLVVIGSTFRDNRGPLATNMFGGGAIYAPASDAAVEIYESTLANNASANGGGIDIAGRLTVVESRFAGNSATGTGGSLGQGGLGGAIQASGDKDISLCGVTLEGNTAGAIGGGLHRVCTTSACSDVIARTSIVGNSAPSGAGVYHQAATLRVEQSTLANNTASANVGGLWHIGTQPIDMENVTIAGNRAASGPGAGVSAEAGTIAFSTVVGNTCAGGGCIGAAIYASGAMQLRATVVANNSVDAPGVPLSCDTPMTDGGDNLQWPVVRPLGGTDDPGSLCAPGIAIADPLLSALALRADVDGEFLVATPAAQSPARATTSSCPATDQLGRPRTPPCSAGAIEP